MRQRRILLERRKIEQKIDPSTKVAETKQPEKQEEPQTENVRPVKTGQQERIVLAKQQTDAMRKQLEQKLDTKKNAEPEVSAERRAQIEQFEREKVARPQDSMEPSQMEAIRVADALKGKSDLGALDEQEKKILLDASMKRWTGEDRDPAQRRVDNKAIDELARQVDDSPEARVSVGKYYLGRAAEKIESRRPDQKEDVLDRTLATSLTANAMVALPEVAERRQVLEELGPKRAAALMNEVAKTPTESLSVESEGKSNGITNRVEVANQLLEATTTGKPTPTSSAMVDVAFANQQAGDTMAKALALHWYPDDPEKREQEASRFQEVFRTQQGLELLAGDSTKSSYEQRLGMLDLFRRHPEWDAKLLEQTSSGFTNPTIMAEIAQPRIDQYQQLRGDTPQVLAKTDLENTIGFSMNLPPETLPENDTEEPHDYYNGEKTAPIVAPIANTIRELGGDEPKVTVLPIQFSSRTTGPVQLPLYRVQDKVTGEDRFVDNQGRSYASFEAWKQENQLPYGVVTHPPNGHLTPGGKAEASWTPKSSNTEQAKEVIDHAVLVGGIVAGGAILIGSGGTMAPVVLGAGALWSAYRSGETLVDRNRHNQSIDPTKDADARAAWINLAASSLSFAGLGATGIAKGLVTTGSRYAPMAATTAAMLNVGASSVDAISAGNAGYTLVANWNRLSGPERAQLVLSVGFWTANSAAMTKTTGSLTAPYNFKAMRQNILYGNLTPEVRADVEKSLKKLGANSEADLATLVSDPDFKTWTPKEQQAYLEQLAALSPEQLALRANGIRARNLGTEPMPDPEYANALQPRIDAAVEAYRKGDYATVERLLTDMEFADRLGVTVDRKTIMMDLDPKSMTKQQIDSITGVARQNSFSFEDKRLQIYDAFLMPNGDPMRATTSGNVPSLGRQLSPIMLEEWMHQLQQASGRPLSKLTTQYLKQKGMEWGDEHHELDIIAAFYEWGFPVDQIGTARAYPERLQFQQWYKARNGGVR